MAERVLTVEVGEEMLEFWLLRTCPRCGGDICLDGKGPERMATCVQCGYEEYEGQVYMRPDVKELVLPKMRGGYRGVAQ